MRRNTRKVTRLSIEIDCVVTGRRTNQGHDEVRQKSVTFDVLKRALVMINMKMTGLPKPLGPK